MKPPKPEEPAEPAEPLAIEFSGEPVVEQAQEPALPQAKREPPPSPPPPKRPSATLPRHKALADLPLLHEEPMLAPSVPAPAPARAVPVAVPTPVPAERPAPVAKKLGRLAGRRLPPRLVWYAGAGVLALLAVGWLIGVLRRSSGGRAEPEAARPDSVLTAPVVTRLDQLGDTVARVVRNYNERALLFSRKQIDCAGLARGLVAVEQRWIAYNLEKRSAATALDSARVARDQSLYARVDSVERHFDGSRCTRP